MCKDRIILKISPQTNIRVTQGDAVAFHIPEECPINCGLPRRSNKQPLVTVSTMAYDFPDLWEILGGDNWKPRRKRKEIRYGCPHCLSEKALQKKRRIERYNKYKVDLLHLAKQAGFEMPTCGWAWYFYLPMPKSFGKHREAMDGQFHLKRPDLNNLEKAAEDSLSIYDERVAQRSGHGKFWTIEEQGWIEILLNQPVYNPKGVIFIDQDALFAKPPRKYKLTKEKAKRGSLIKYKREDKLK